MNIKREIVVEILNDIEKRDVVITPQAVIDIARPKDSPIHNCFEWDNTKAAKSWRRRQARELMNYKYEFEKKEPLEKFYSVELIIDKKKKRGYVSETTVKENKSIYKQVLTDAIIGLRGWQKRFKAIKELKGVINEKELIRLEKMI